MCEGSSALRQIIAHTSPSSSRMIYMYTWRMHFNWGWNSQRLLLSSAPRANSSDDLTDARLRRDKSRISPSSIPSRVQNRSEMRKMFGADKTARPAKKQTSSEASEIHNKLEWKLAHRTSNPYRDQLAKIDDGKEAKIILWFALMPFRASDVHSRSPTYLAPLERWAIPTHHQQMTMNLLTLLRWWHSAKCSG